MLDETIPGIMIKVCHIFLEYYNNIIQSYYSKNIRLIKQKIEVYVHITNINVFLKVVPKYKPVTQHMGV